MQTKSEMINRIAELAKENAELKAYMDVNEDFKTAWEELKAENVRLRTCLEMQRTDETKQYIEKVNVERKNYKLKQTLQEIKEIADAKCNECKYGKGGISCKYGDCGEAKLHLIVQLITKAESEG